MDDMFIINKEYDRDKLLDFVGSNQGQSGIIYGPKQPNCVIVTSGGKHGKNSGYLNLKNDDGTWNYIGQGSTGDQDPNRFTNSLLTSKERDVLLFSTREPSYLEIKTTGNSRKKYKFEGIFNVLDWGFETVENGDRIGDKLLKFILIPAKNLYSELPSNDNIDYVEDSQPAAPNTGFNGLAGEKNRGFTIREYIIRSQKVKDYALERSNGVCELCNKPAPFTTLNGVPFLEVHHILKLSDDGPDAPENVAAICPNCHKEAHFGQNIENIKNKLLNQFQNKK